MLEQTDNARHVKETQVTDDEGIVYDVNVHFSRETLLLEAAYNEAATAENYDDVADVYGTGPVAEAYEIVVPVLGKPRPPSAEEILDWLEHER